jgi:DNA-binding NarL/FixJ family response regulator
VLAAAPAILEMAEVSDGVEAIHQLRHQAFDLVLLDIDLQSRDGLDVLRQFRSEFPDLPVLVVTSCPERVYAVRCLQLGAAGYLGKSASAEQLLNAVQQVASGGIYVNDEVANLLALSLRSDSAKPAHDTMSRREFQVFSLIAAGKTVSEIAKALCLSASTVSTYRSRVMEKIGSSNDVETVLYAVRQRLIHFD